MRPIRLKLAGMHSYREMQEVDFEILCQAGLFGIFGPTGSGKSTILDAITLALYGQVVRLGGGNHPKEVLNQLEQRVFVSFTFELGTGDERKRYTIEREFGLDKKGNKRQPEVRLIQSGALTGEPDVVLESKATAATAAVEDLIGLTLQDFTRAVVLPQGQFSRFLTLKGSERNEMLQRMFRLHIYGEKLSERVRHALDQVKEQMHQLQLATAALGDAGPEALEQARQTFAEAASIEREFTEQKQELTGKLKELEQLHQWQAELAGVQQQLQQQTAKEAEMAALTSRMGEWEASIRLWPLVQQYERLDQEWVRTGQALEQSRGQQEAARLALEEAEAQYAQAQAELAAQEPQLIEQKGRLVQAQEWEAELKAIREEQTALEREWQEVSRGLLQTEQQLQQDEAALENWQQEWNRLEEASQKAMVAPEWRDRITQAREAKQQWEREQAKLREQETEQKTLVQRLQVLTEKAAADKRDWEQAESHLAAHKEQMAKAADKPVMSDAEWEQSRNVLGEMKQIGRQWREGLQAVEGWQEKRQKIEQEHIQVQKRCQELALAAQSSEAIVLARQTEREELRQAWEQWQQENMARYLRERLEQGKECPVCGSVHHSLDHQDQLADGEAKVAGDELRTRIKAAEEAGKAAEQKAAGDKEAWVVAKGALAAVEERLAAIQAEHKELAARLTAIKAECHGHGQPWAVDTFEELISVYQREEKALAAKHAEREQAKAEREQQQKQLEVLREAEADKKRQMEKSALLLEQAQQSAAEIQARLAVVQQAANQAWQALNEVRQDVPVEGIDQQYEEIGRLDRLLAQLQRTRAEQEALKSQLLTQVETAKTRRADWKNREAALGERLADRKRMWEQKHAQWLERTGGTPSSEGLARTEQALSLLRQALAQAEDKRKTVAEARQLVQNDLVKHSEALAVLTRQRSEAHEALYQGLQETGFANVERVQERYAERGQLPQAREQVEAYTRALTQLRYEEDRLLQAIAGRTVSTEELLAAKEAWGTWEQSFAEAQKQVAVAKEHVDRMEKNHSKWQELHQQIVEQQDEQSRLEELKKLFEAKAFVQFIAEEKLVTIARDASYHLKRMTANRYGLEIGDEGEFVLRDEGAGGMRRPVSTLSGGETFLTSLSLALALSMEIQMRGGRLEFFFLDEGFGTLDPELLEVVMDALERLRMDDFTIGVISHVPEIRVRMPRRLVVTPAEPMGKGSKLLLEME
ncbi:AAA family ATPase [Brevibacillus sp. HD3.3A]|uniref:AAA family ATPase n=1 Tax=Brevibacillus sp. HD3.3A TaxID=2738979 RepID=UPI00156A9F70|nr:SMC family ATPase [Brevibacillus sp. HD3.3A]UED68354.1 SMC family ATPase [Brevibacillus sp. HD3.3A]